MRTIINSMHLWQRAQRGNCINTDAPNMASEAGTKNLRGLGGIRIFNKSDEISCNHGSVSLGWLHTKQLGGKIMGFIDDAKKNIEDGVDRVKDKVDEIKADAKVKKAEAERDATKAHNDVKEELRD